MKNKTIKINKKNVLNIIQNEELKQLVAQYFSHIKLFIIGCFNLYEAIQSNNEKKITIQFFVDRIEHYFNMNLNNSDSIENLTTNNIKNDESLNFIIDNYIRIFALDFRILQNKTNLDLIYEYSKFQIRLFLLAKNKIIVFFPRKLNMIIEAFNNFRKPIYEYVEIN